MSGSKRINLWQLLVWALVAAIVVLAVVFRQSISAQAVLSFLPDNPLLAFGVFMLLYAVVSVSVVIPMIILYVASGLVFGGATALAVNLCGGAVCILIPYLLGRYGSFGLLKGAKDKLPPSVTGYLDAHPMSAFRKNVLLRAIGIVPSCTVSYFMGEKKERFPGYFFGSLIGFLPDMIPQTLMGVAATDPGSRLFISAVCTAAALKAAAIALALLIKRRSQ